MLIKPHHYPLRVGEKNPHHDRNSNRVFNMNRHEQKNAGKRPKFLKRKQDTQTSGENR